WSADIEDHTHDPLSPWAAGSTASYCVASLRKSLPIPDGAALWSPSGRALPSVEKQGPNRRAAVFDKLAAMMLKTQYLAGTLPDQSLYRDLAIRGESELASAAPAAISELSHQLLRRMPVHEWRARRATNHSLFVSLLSEQTWLA